MKKIQFLLVLTLFSFSSMAQQFSSSDPEYIRLVQLGEKAMHAEKFDSCMTYYTDAFTIQQTSVLSTMRAAACGYSGDNLEYYDTQLSKAMELNWGMALSIFEQEEFDFLRNTGFERELNLRHDLVACKEGIDIDLMKEMAVISVTDQQYRRQMGPIIKEHGWDCPQMDSLWALQNPVDEANTARISEIIDEQGYPGKSSVGPRYASTAFLVIQHADSTTQRKYLPILKEAADAGELKWRSLALLIDRVNLGLKKPQVYGSQVGQDKETLEHYFFEIEDPENVDKRREEVGLGPLNDYAQRYDFTWDVEVHKKKLAVRKAKKKGSK